MSTRRPRYRYIAFRVEGPQPLRREDVLAALRAATPRLWLVAFTGSVGLARTTHLEKDAAIRALTGLASIAGESVRVATIGTSGTIRAATRKYLRPRDRARRNGEKNPYK